MSQNNRGAAQVSLMWVIALAIIMLLSAGFGYIQNGQFTKSEGLLATAKSNLETEKAALAVERNARADDAVKFGFTGTGGSSVSPEAIQAWTNEFVTRFALDSNAITKLEDLSGPVFAKYDEAIGQRDGLQSELNQVRNDLVAKTSSNSTAMSGKDSTIASLRAELDDTKNSKDQEIVNLERQRDSLRDQLRDRDTTVTQLRAVNDQQTRDSASVLANLQQRNDIISGRLNEVSRRAETADGSILAVNGELGAAWVDLGYNDRLTVGMQFDVRNASSNALKGRLQIVSVDADRAEARILSQVDPYDPVRANDLVLNAVYDPNRKPVAALLGNGFGKYNANDIRSMLARVGVEVRENVTSETDYLLLGTPFFDEETGDVIGWDSQDGYKAATSLSVEVLPMRDWTQWLGL
ncbi:MAG: hypothetical protein COA70_08940 [Planctomycetota bacterium]|nr:MAG: hypothetical protein COA70_08940 [Planctomycetota bacterium]